MPTSTEPTFEPRKTPIQSRSTATVDAIHEATIQVLVSEGAERLTTTRVADRAGVSVGTLYQYYPNKKSLLRAILEQHLNRVTTAVEAICHDSHGHPLDTMIEALMRTFVDAKMYRKDASVAFYAISSQLNSEPLIAAFNRRYRLALTAMLLTAPDARIRELDFTVTMLVAAMGGTTRAVLESGASRKKIEDLRRHLILLAQSYLRASA